MALLTTRQHRGRKRRLDRIAKRMLHYHKPSRPLLGYLQDEAVIREDIVGSANPEIKRLGRDNTSAEPFVNELLRRITIGNPSQPRYGYSRANMPTTSGSNTPISHGSSPSLLRNVTYLRRFTRIAFL